MVARTGLFDEVHCSSDGSHVAAIHRPPEVGYNIPPLVLPTDILRKRTNIRVEK